jgi:hypothetical protein
MTARLAFIKLVSTKIVYNERTDGEPMETSNDGLSSPYIFSYLAIEFFKYEAVYLIPKILNLFPNILK